MSIEPYALTIRQKMVESARAMLDGKLSYIEGARQICRLRWDAKIPDFDADIMAFVGIDSETDALPLGDERQNWLRDSLVKLQPEIERAEAWAQGIGRSACKS